MDKHALILREDREEGASKLTTHSMAQCEAGEGVQGRDGEPRRCSGGEEWLWLEWRPRAGQGQQLGDGFVGGRRRWRRGEVPEQRVLVHGRRDHHLHRGSRRRPDAGAAAAAAGELLIRPDAEADAAASSPAADGRAGPHAWPQERALWLADAEAALPHRPLLAGLDDGAICSLAGLVTTINTYYCLLAILVSHSHLISSHLQLISISWRQKLFLWSSVQTAISKTQTRQSIAVPCNARGLRSPYLQRQEGAGKRSHLLL